jgi:hypothetical protein
MSWKCCALAWPKPPHHPGIYMGRSRNSAKCFTMHIRYRSWESSPKSSRVHGCIQLSPEKLFPEVRNPMALPMRSLAFSPPSIILNVLTLPQQNVPLLQSLETSPPPFSSHDSRLHLDATVRVCCQKIVQNTSLLFSGHDPKPFLRHTHSVTLLGLNVPWYVTEQLTFTVCISGAFR